MHIMEQNVDINQMGLRPNRLEMGFQNKGEKPRTRIWTLVKYDARVRVIPRSIENCSNAGMTPAAMKVVVMA